MRMKDLRIRRRDSWEHNPGILYGEITFVGDTHETKLVIDEEMSQQILLLCSQQIRKSANEVANLLLADLDASLPALEHKHETETETANF